ncbi:MAG: hypothetical protein H0X29_01025 [Parachlamydiaceae bacterium]|nr:hypothetical protein [Parachlamydiaceae bacterium]
MVISSNFLSTSSSTQGPSEVDIEINSSKIPHSNKERRAHVYLKKWKGKEYLNTVNIDPSNHLKITHPPTSNSKSHYLSLEIFENHRPFTSLGLPGYCLTKPLGKASIELNSDSQKNLLITDDQIETLTHVDKPTAINRPSITYFGRLLLAGGPEIIKSLLSRIFSYLMTVDKVQSLFNLFGPHYARSEPTLPNLLDDLLNSICAIDYKREGNQISWIANWDNYQFDRETSLPNVTVIARKEQETLTIESIKVQFRGEKEQIILPDQTTPDELKLAIYMARSSFAIKGEAEIHLAEGHLLPGIFAHTFLTAISKENPLYAVTARYLENLEFINWLGGNGIIFGKGSVIELSALSDRSVAELIIRYMIEKSDFLNYKPIEPISKTHHRAIVGKVHYETLLNYFSSFICDNWDKIVPFKNEIFEWSESLNRKLSSIPKIMPDPNSFSKEIEGKRLALCLASIVNQTTFLHWSSHARQELLTHVDLASLSLSNKGRGPNGMPVKFGNTPKEAANLQLKISRTLLNFKAHRFVNYAHPDLLKRINRIRDLYIPYPLKEMFVTTEI